MLVRALFNFSLSLSHSVFQKIPDGSSKLDFFRSASNWFLSHYVLRDTKRGQEIWTITA